MVNDVAMRVPSKREYIRSRSQLHQAKRAHQSLKNVLKVVETGPELDPSEVHSIYGTGPEGRRGRVRNKAVHSRKTSKAGN